LGQARHEDHEIIVYQIRKGEKKKVDAYDTEKGGKKRVELNPSTQAKGE